MSDALYCPDCGEAAVPRLRFSDGHALRRWHCRGCGWDSDEAGALDFEELTERIRDAQMRGDFS